MEMYNPAHPGIILKEEVLEPLGIGVAEAALKLGVSRQTLSGVLNGRIGITPNMALRIAKSFNTTPDVWLREQLAYDLWRAKQNIDLSDVQVIAM
ncbi:MAG: HigA family addiction module antidote protein [Heliobacteriaceae bacterium]|jgi:addiction module HigA family antidote|nr:HigA family addiction module antidote protein [Heliobacteriaceae bacterium]